MLKSKTFKTVESLVPADLERHPVWQFVNDDSLPDTAVRPVRRIPARSLEGRLVGTQVRLANGDKSWATLGNIDAANAQLTEHFLLLSVYRQGKWFTMARYHDVDAKSNGPKALARFLSLALEEVFPISYDIRSVCIGDEKALKGIVTQEPRKRLTRAQIIALAVP